MRTAFPSSESGERAEPFLFVVVCDCLDNGMEIVGQLADHGYGVRTGGAPLGLTEPVALDLRLAVLVEHDGRPVFEDLDNLALALFVPTVSSNQRLQFVEEGGHFSSGGHFSFDGNIRE